MVAFSFHILVIVLLVYFPPYRYIGLFVSRLRNMVDLFSRLKDKHDCPFVSRLTDMVVKFVSRLRDVHACSISSPEDVPACSFLVAYKPAAYLLNYFKKQIYSAND